MLQGALCEIALGPECHPTYSRKLTGTCRRLKGQHSNKNDLLKDPLFECRLKAYDQNMHQSISWLSKFAAQQRLAGLEAGIAGLKDGTAGLRQDLDGLANKHAGLNNLVATLINELGGLHVKS